MAGPSDDFDAYLANIYSRGMNKPDSGQLLQDAYGRGAWPSIPGLPDRSGEIRNIDRPADPLQPAYEGAEPALTGSWGLGFGRSVHDAYRDASQGQMPQTEDMLNIAMAAVPGFKGKGISKGFEGLRQAVNDMPTTGKAGAAPWGTLRDALPPGMHEHFAPALDTPIYLRNDPAAWQQAKQGVRAWYHPAIDPETGDPVANGSIHISPESNAGNKEYFANLLAEEAIHALQDAKGRRLPSFDTSGQPIPHKEMPNEITAQQGAGYWQNRILGQPPSLMQRIGDVPQVPLDNPIVEAYHGTKQGDVQSFDPLRNAYEGVPATWFSQTPDRTVNRHAMVEGPQGGAVLKRHIDTTGFSDINWPEWNKAEIYHGSPMHYDDLAMSNLLKQEREKGVPGIIIRNIADDLDAQAKNPSTHYAIFDPSRIRSPHEASGGAINDVLAQYRY